MWGKTKLHPDTTFSNCLKPMMRKSYKQPKRKQTNKQSRHSMFWGKKHMRITDFSSEATQSRRQWSNIFIIGKWTAVNLEFYTKKRIFQKYNRTKFETTPLFSLILLWPFHAPPCFLQFAYTYNYLGVFTCHTIVCSPTYNLEVIPDQSALQTMGDY